MRFFVEEYGMSDTAGYFAAYDMPFPTGGMKLYMAIANLATGELKYIYPWGTDGIEGVDEIIAIAEQINEEY